MCALGYATPNLGDAGATGLISAHGVNVAFMAEGYRRTRDPKLAIAAYHANGDKAEGLGRDIYSADPDALSKKIEAIAKPSGPFVVKSDLMTGYGMAMLQSGTKDNGIAVPVTFGHTSHHAHPDTLGLDVLAFNNWLLPDHGYPEYGTTWPSRDEWTDNTISHNTVVVDEQKQKEIWSGRTKLFKTLPGLSVVTLDGRNAYPQTKQYERTVLLVDAPDDNHYVVDLFRVEGGTDHVYSIHGPPGETTVTGLNLVEQQGGSYAGPDVAPEAHMEGTRMGYSYLFNVKRDNAPPGEFVVDWKAQPGYRNVKEGDDIHVRYHALTQVNDVALANGKPPQTKGGNPKTLPYLLLHRKGNDLGSTFVSVIEPYKTAPIIKSVARPVLGDKPVSLRVELADGTTDLFIIQDTDQPDRISMMRMQAGKITSAIVINGSSFPTPDVKIQSTPAYTGKVLKMNRDLAGGGWMIVDAKLPESVVGEHIMIDSNTDRNPCYKIEKAEKIEGGTRIDCGPISFVQKYLGPTITIRSQVVPKDYTGGFSYDFEEGDTFRIPMHAVWSAEKDATDARR
ncbi:MAG: heparinase II/III family protein [Tepidisphaeraceae bacterium]